MTTKQIAQQNMLAALNKLLSRISNDAGKTISSVQIERTTGELIFNYADATSENLGRVVGAAGKDGVSILDVQLYPDPVKPTDVYIQTSLSNGVILRTRDSIAGYNGASIANAYIQDNAFHFVLDDANNTELTPIPVTGLTVASVTNAQIDANGHLIFTLSNGQTLDAGLASQLEGRGIADLKITDGALEIAYSDAPEEYANLGQVVGDSVVSAEVDGNGDLIFHTAGGSDINVGTADALKGVGIDDMKLEGGFLKVKYSNSADYVSVGSLDGVSTLSIDNGKLVYTKNSDPSTAIVISDYTYFTGMRLENNHLIVTTNQPGTAGTIDLGEVSNIKGDQGVGISNIAITGDQMVITLTDTSEINLPISGIAPVIITGAHYDAQADDVVFELSNGSTISSGIKEDLRGVGVDHVELKSTGELNIFYSTAPTEAVSLGIVKFLVSMDVVDGKLFATYNTSPTPVEISTILGVAQVVAENGVVSVQYTDGTSEVLGSIRAVVGTSIDELGNFTVNYSDETSEVIGNVKGPKGDQGDGFTSATINASGDLILTTSGGQEINAGHTRDTVENLIGAISPFTATAGQSEFLVAHNGKAAVFVNSELLDEAALDLTAGDRIGFVTPFSGGEKVVVFTFAPTGAVITGKGISSITETSVGVFEITLENDTKYTINTVTEPDIASLPPGIETIAFNESGHLIVTLTDGSVHDLGPANNANNVKSAVITDGNLIITLDDDTQFNAGSVVSSLAITNAYIDANGHLQIVMNSGGTFDAGVVANYVQSAIIDTETGHLKVTLSDNTVIDAGAVVNPLLGAVTNFTAAEGQTEFVITHSNHEVLVFANGIPLSSDSYDLSDPNKIVLNTARHDTDKIKIVLFSQGGQFVAGLLSEAAAADETFYGKRNGVAGFYPIGATMVAQSYDFVAVAGQTTFTNIPHNGIALVFVDGALKQDGFTLPTNPPNQVVFSPALTGGEKVKIVPMSSPNPLGPLVNSSYTEIANQTYSNGGTALQRVWQERQLNVMPYNALGVILNKNRMLLQAGIYWVEGWAFSNNALSTALRLYDNTQLKVALQGAAQYSTTPGKTTISGYLILDHQASISLQHYFTRGLASIGLGIVGDGSTSASNVQAAMGIPMTHASLKIWKIG